MVGAGRRVGQATMGHAQQRAIRRLVDQVDLDQARARRYVFFALVPAKTVGEAVHRNNLGEAATGDVLSGDVEEVKPAGMRFHCRLGAHPAQDFLRIGEKREHGRRRCGDLDLASDHERFIHSKSSLTPFRTRAHFWAPSYLGNDALMTRRWSQPHYCRMTLPNTLAWLLDEASTADGADHFLAGLGARLIADDVPLAGSALTLAAPHPMI